MELVLLDLVAEQAAGEGRGVDRHARELGQDVRQGADVILVGVGDEEGPDVGLALLEVGDVGDDEVDPEHLLVGEHQAAVDDDDVVAVLEHVHVLADFADAAERDDPEREVCSWHEGLVRPWWEVDQKMVRSAAASDASSGGMAAARAPARGPARRSRRASGVGARSVEEGRPGAVDARRARLSRRTCGAWATSSKLCRSTSAPRRAAAGWYIAKTVASRAPLAGSTAAVVPCAWEIRAPGMNRPIECRPSVTMRAGSRTSSWRFRYGAQAATSSGSGSRLSGGGT